MNLLSLLFEIVQLATNLISNSALPFLGSHCHCHSWCTCNFRSFAVKPVVTELLFLLEEEENARILAQ